MSSEMIERVARAKWERRQEVARKAGMKPLYHCSNCGRLSTRLGSYKCIEAQLYCANDKCPPQRS